MFLMLLVAAGPGRQAAADDSFGESFSTQVRPFLERFCLDCHGAVDPEAKFDLSPYTTVESIRRDLPHWNLVLKRLAAGEMPPEDAERQPGKAQRQAVVDWITGLRRREAERNAGDPGPVLARRLSNAEYDYTIHDLTGVDIRPTREFPVDPANEAGFANSGESLAMSPALLKKYLDAARLVAEHLVLAPTGLDFAPHPVVVESDRDKYCVSRIIEFYQRQPIDLADYFFAAWRHQHRDVLDGPETLAECAADQQVSPKYLAIVWELLRDGQQDAGPLAELRRMWNDLPGPGDESADHPVDDVRESCRKMRDFVHEEREKLIPPADLSATSGLKRTLQPWILWVNNQAAANRRRGQIPEPDGTPRAELQAAALERFCSVFPDRFFVSERGRTFLDPRDQNKGRYLSAGFHLMVGYFRDDQPLVDLVLDEAAQRELDALWRELNLVTRAPLRQFRDFIYFERAESTRYLTYPEFDFARGEDNDITSAAKMSRVAELFVARAREEGISPAGLNVLQVYFDNIAAQVRQVQADLQAAEPRHLADLVEFAQRAWRRPLADEERDDLLRFYRELRDEQQLEHEEAVRDVLASILVSPRFSYRLDPAPEGKGAVPLSDLALASRLSYFLWSSMPDAELLARAEAGDLHQPQVLAAQARRMLADPRVRRLAVEFGGQWLDFRQFEQHNAVDRTRFPMFNDQLRQAMFEEPVRFTVDLIQRDGSVREFLDARHTLVNPILAAHYGITLPDSVGGGERAADQWTRVEDATVYGRGGLLGMSVFLTKNSPGLRTSPVKRGYWVVRRLLGEEIPAPPPNVPELPEDEAKLGELSLRDVLVRHRAVKSCAVCHDKFDAIGLAFEGYGPVGQRREVDLGGRAIDDRAEFPDGSQGQGLDGLRSYLNTRRQDEFVDNLCRKLLAYALGRGLLLSDESTIERMRNELASHDGRFSRLVETIVTSPQFLKQRGRDYDGGAE
ncbi:MAG: DUF1592 domain-containing protein [Pirellulaceae bacterium]|nr:DUF1592 domain-containing protein [Pirellulaceae bacterium]